MFRQVVSYWMKLLALCCVYPVVILGSRPTEVRVVCVCLDVRKLIGPQRYTKRCFVVRAVKLADHTRRRMTTSLI